MVRISLLFLMLCHWAVCQNNTGTNIASNLIECYANPSVTTRDYLLPSTMNSFLAVIRKVEEANPTLNSRMIALMILHRFRQDGIMQNKNDEFDDGIGVPYAPKGREVARNKIQMDILTPIQGYSYNNESLTLTEKCSLHYMISSSIETKYRGVDENCQRVARYQMRTKRDAEMLESAQISNCPLESGVVYTKWGTVKAGLILAGIAAGLETIKVPVQNLSVDSRYGSTIAAELSEVALIQPKLSTKVVGNAGSWNSTILPKYYFLVQNDKNHLQLTDAEIRGGVDGLALGLNAMQYKDSKLSQIIDLYYSRGLQNGTIRACERQYNNDTDTLRQQVLSFTYLLEPEANLGYTANQSRFSELSNVAVSAFTSYTGSLQDAPCPTDELIERVATDIAFYIDTHWDYAVLSKFISHILDNIDVNKYETRYSVYTSQDGEALVNRSTSILDFYELVNKTYYDQLNQSPATFTYGTVLQSIEDHFKADLDNYVGNDKSQIAILLPIQEPASTDKDLFRNKKTNSFRRVLPNLRILVGTAGNKDSYTDIVTNVNTDVFSIPQSDDETNIKSLGTTVIDNLKKIPRSIINPLCKSTFQVTDKRDFTSVQFVEPTGITYNKIAPHYYKGASNLKIIGQGYGTVRICTSRSEPNPKNNITGVACIEITNNQYTEDISGYCDDDVINCQPIYISATGLSTNNRCTDDLCRFSDSIKYTVIVERASCPNSTKSIYASAFLICLMTLITYLNIV